MRITRLSKEILNMQQFGMSHLPQRLPYYTKSRKRKLALTMHSQEFAEWKRLQSTLKLALNKLKGTLITLIQI